MPTKKSTKKPNAYDAATEQERANYNTVMGKRVAEQGRLLGQHIASGALSSFTLRFKRAAGLSFEFNGDLNGVFVDALTGVKLRDLNPPLSGKALAELFRLPVAATYADLSIGDENRRDGLRSLVAAGLAEPDSLGMLKLTEAGQARLQIELSAPGV